MPIIIVPVSGGVESTALLHKALQGDNEVHPVYVAVNGDPRSSVFDLTAAEHIVNWFEEHKGGYVGRLRPLTYMINPVFFHLHNNNKIENTPANYGVTQQFQLVYNISLLRSKFWDCNPGVWIGWLKEDGNEFSFNEYDFSAEEYKELLKLPVTLGTLSNIDRTCKPFRAPFWEMTKSDVYLSLPEELKTLVVPNGSEYYNGDGDLVRTPWKAKRKEWINANIPIKDSYVFSAAQISRIGRYAGKKLLGKDFNLSPNYDALIELVYRDSRWHPLPFTNKDFYTICSANNLKSIVREAQHNIPAIKPIG